MSLRVPDNSAVANRYYKVKQDLLSPVLALMDNSGLGWNSGPAQSARSGFDYALP